MKQIIAIKETIKINNPCQKLVMPINSSSGLKIKTKGNMAVLISYQKAWNPVLIGSQF